MVITNDVKEWTYEEPMPYGRIVSDAVIQPNGKILIMNGGRHGTTAGGIGLPVLYGTASEVFCYDPAKPAGQRWEVFAKSPNRRFYHSSAVFVPDGTTIIMGTDEATYDPSTSYDHEAERFTPPWLLDGLSTRLYIAINNIAGYRGGGSMNLWPNLLRIVVK